MGIQIAVAFPVLPGQADRVRHFDEEIEQHTDEWERLNRGATVTRYGVWLQESPMGDLAIVVMEADDPTQISREFTETDYDQWWLDYLRDVHGIDLHGVSQEQIPTPPPQVYEWKAE
jgi:hypothetical protein